MSGFRLQTPGEDITYSIDWTSWLPSGENVASETWAISPSAGVSLVDLGQSQNVSSVRVSGLTDGEIYVLTCTMTSDGGPEIAERSIIIRCGPR